MSDQILVDGDFASFLPAFGAAVVTVRPGSVRGSGIATIGGRKVCVAGDEASVSVPGCMDMTPQYVIPGSGTLTISGLAGNQTAAVVTAGGKAVLLKGGSFSASFEVQTPAQQPPPRAGRAASRPDAAVFGQGRLHRRQHPRAGGVRRAMTPPPAPTPIAGDLRDGTSQSSRMPDALRPDRLPIDPRSAGDWLRFLKSFAGRLIYYDEGNRPAGFWDGLFDGIGDGARLGFDEAAGFAERPQDVTDAELNAILRRPHLVLLLAFLRRLAVVQEAMNGLSARHLDFAYRTVLGFEPRGAVPGRAMVLVDPAEGLDEVEVPAGTRLPAGRDIDGRQRYASTGEALRAHATAVARLMSVFVDKTVVGIAEAHGGSRTIGAFLEMLTLPYGEPDPGGALPPFDGKELDWDTLVDLGRRARTATAAVRGALAQVRHAVAMGTAPAAPIPADWWNGASDWERDAVGERTRRAEWAFRNGEDVTAGNRLEQALAAVGGRGVVEDIDAVCALAMIERYFFMPVDEFARMMLVAGDGAATPEQWGEVYGLLAAAYRRKVFARRREALLRVGRTKPTFL